jgi:hypothetical protein
MEITIKVSDRREFNIPGCEYHAVVTVVQQPDGHPELTHFGGKYGVTPREALYSLLRSVESSVVDDAIVRNAVANRLRVAVIATQGAAQ